ncbi:MAG TPA: hypothetical protein VMK32_00465 [Burkholderiaceae bacterium]|nr:hypothetical protein [Burkholderiaceae bacterium]
MTQPPAEAAFPLQISVGPFRVAVVHAPRERMRARRRLMEYELSHGIVWLHESLTGERLASQFLNAVVRLIHKAAGCQTGCIEEAFTQSLAAGLVSFAQQNRDVWIWFNRLLATAVKPGARFEHAASGKLKSRLQVPKAVLVGHRVARFAPLRHEIATRNNVDGYFSSTKDGHLVELYEGLHGPQRAVVFVHEVTHAIHAAARLRQRDTRERFVAAQVAGWLQFVRRNPGAWMWLLATIREQAEFEPLALLA